MVNFFIFCPKLQVKTFEAPNYVCNLISPVIVSPPQRSAVSVLECWPRGIFPLKQPCSPIFNRPDTWLT